jgi:7,8-dihydro-6-hydroxymethylpterin-pyrophosphokinase
MKEQIDEYFTTRINDLKEYYMKFCTPSEREHFGVILSNLYEHIYNNLNKLEHIINSGDIHYYCVGYIYNQRNWNGTDFKKYININENYSDDIALSNILDDEDVYEIKAQQEIDFTNKLMKINIALSKMELHEKILYDKYFNQKQSMRKIGLDIGVSHVSIHHSIQTIKKKIKNTKI